MLPACGLHHLVEQRQVANRDCELSVLRADVRAKQPLPVTVTQNIKVTAVR